LDHEPQNGGGIIYMPTLLLISQPSVWRNITSTDFYNETIVNVTRGHYFRHI